MHVIPLDNFFYHMVMDEDGFDWCSPADQLCFREARPGDHLTTTFQCDPCSFRNIQLQDPLPTLAHGELLLCCIRRALLDALWVRESNTVLANPHGVNHLLRLWGKVGVAPQFPPLGPFPVQDSLGRGSSGNASEVPGAGEAQPHIPTV